MLTYRQPRVFFSIIYSGKKGNKSLTTKQWKRKFISLKHVLIVNWQKILSHPRDEKAASATCTSMFVLSCMKYRKKKCLSVWPKILFQISSVLPNKHFVVKLLFKYCSVVNYYCFIHPEFLSSYHTILKESITHVDINNSLWNVHLISYFEKHSIN